MILKNITRETLSVSLFGHNYEIPAGWSLSSDELIGGEETLRYIAARLTGKITLADKEGNEIEKVDCPGCGSKVFINKKDAENISS